MPILKGENRQQAKVAHGCAGYGSKDEIVEKI